MDANAIRRRYGELIQKIKSFRMAIGDYKAMLKVTDMRGKSLRVPSAGKRTSNHLRPVSGRLSQTRKVGSFAGESPYRLAMPARLLQVPAKGSVSFADTTTNALNDIEQFRAFTQTETASVDEDLRPVSSKRKTTMRPKSSIRRVESGRGQRPPSCRRRLEEGPCSPAQHPNVLIESPKFIRLLYEDLLHSLGLLRTQLGKRPSDTVHQRNQDDACLQEWKQLDGLVSDLERQLRVCEVRMLTVDVREEVETQTVLSPVAPECGSDHDKDETMPPGFVEPVRTNHGPTIRPLAMSLPSATGWNQPIVSKNICLRRSDSVLQASPRQKRLPRQSYPYGSSFPEVPPLPLLKQRTFLNVIAGASPTIQVVPRKRVKPNRGNTWLRVKPSREKTWFY